MQISSDRMFSRFDLILDEGSDGGQVAGVDCE